MSDFSNSLLLLIVIFIFKTIQHNNMLYLQTFLIKITIFFILNYTVWIDFFYSFSWQSILSLYFSLCAFEILIFIFEIFYSVKSILLLLLVYLPTLFDRFRFLYTMDMEIYRISFMCPSTNRDSVTNAIVDFIKKKFGLHSNHSTIVFNALFYCH